MKPPAALGVGPRHTRWHDDPDVLYLLALLYLHALGSLILLGILIVGFY